MLNILNQNFLGFNVFFPPADSVLSSLQECALKLQHQIHLLFHLLSSLCEGHQVSLNVGSSLSFIVWFPPLFSPPLPFSLSPLSSSTLRRVGVQTKLIRSEHWEVQSGALRVRRAEPWLEHRDVQTPEGFCESVIEWSSWRRRPIRETGSTKYCTESVRRKPVIQTKLRSCNGSMRSSDDSRAP